MMRTSFDSNNMNYLLSRSCSSSSISSRGYSSYTISFLAGDDL